MCSAAAVSPPLAPVRRGAAVHRHRRADALRPAPVAGAPRCSAGVEHGDRPADQGHPFLVARGAATAVVGGLVLLLRALIPRDPPIQRGPTASTLAQAGEPQAGQLPAAPEEHGQKQPVQPGGTWRGRAGHRGWGWEWAGGWKAWQPIAALRELLPDCMTFVEEPRLAGAGPFIAPDGQSDQPGRISAASTGPFRRWLRLQPDCLQELQNTDQDQLPRPSGEGDHDHPEQQLQTTGGCKFCLHQMCIRMLQRELGRGRAENPLLFHPQSLLDIN